MTVIEQLRQEINELRERIVVLENRTEPLVNYGKAYAPTFIVEKDPYAPPFTITCREK